jgi:hypothetical protein
VSDGSDHDSQYSCKVDLMAIAQPRSKTIDHVFTSPDEAVDLQLEYKLKLSEKERDLHWAMVSFAK